MLEFINMCAIKIQASFKAYIFAKRHLFAVKKLKKFREKMLAVVKGWKTRHIYSCKRIK
jgi:hypothetical protein